MLSIRPATIDDAALLRTFIRELAEFERLLEFCVIEAADLARDGFGPDPKFRALIAEWEGKPAGYALFFGYYSTWRGPGMYLEDLFVRSQFRGLGIGKSLLATVARTAEQENRIFLKWSVLNWNEPAIKLYQSLGADFLDDWREVFLVGDNLKKLADKAS